MLQSFTPNDPRAKALGSLGAKEAAARLSPAERKLKGFLAIRARWGYEPWTEAQKEEWRRGYEVGFAMASGWLTGKRKKPAK